MPYSLRAAGLRHPASVTTATHELARAFDTAQRDVTCTQLNATAEPSTDDCAELAGAVRAFVVARRADGSPPERVLAVIKSVTSPYFVDGVDEVHGDRLQALILREFLTSFYDVAPIAPAPRSAR
jgi:hypothetical protein